MLAVFIVEKEPTVTPSSFSPVALQYDGAA